MIRAAMFFSGGVERSIYLDKSLKSSGQILTEALRADRDACGSCRVPPDGVWRIVSSPPIRSSRTS